MNKIETVGKILFVISIISAVVFFIVNIRQLSFLIFVISFGLVFAGFIIYTFFEGFGRLVDATEENVTINMEILTLLRNKDIDVIKKQEDTKIIKNSSNDKNDLDLLDKEIFEEKIKINPINITNKKIECPNCGYRLQAGRSNCPSCGQKFN